MTLSWKGEKKGMTGDVDRYKFNQKIEVVWKKNLKSSSIEGYLLLQNMGIGTPTLKHSNNVIYMKKGMPLP